MADKSSRVQLSHIVGLQISSARVRRFIDKKGINRLVEDEISKDKLALQAIEKEGARPLSTPPAKPQHPVDATGAKLDVPQADQDAYTTALAKFHAEKTEWQNYKSAKFTTLETVYGVAKDLSKVQKLLSKKSTVEAGGDNKKKFTNKNVEELAEVSKKMLSTAPTAKLLGKTNLSDAAAVSTLLASLHTAHPELKYFFQRDAASSKRIRFNERATVALATVMEAMCEQLAEHAMKYVVANNKKIIKPDHCVTEGLEQCSLYPLFSSLPAMRAIGDRQTRRAKYDADVKRKQEEHNRKAKADARRKKKNYKPTKLEHAPFEQTECEAGFAQMRPVDGAEPVEGVVPTECVWFGIDVPSQQSDVVDTTDFVFYVRKVCKSVMDHGVEDGNSEWSEIRISTAITNFLSDITIQFIARVLPLISLLINTKKHKVKTVDDRIVMRVVEILLADSNHNAHGEVTFTDAHKDLFATVDEKLKLLDAHKAKKRGVAGAETAATEEDADADEEDEEDAETPAPAPVTAPVETERARRRKGDAKK